MQSTRAYRGARWMLQRRSALRRVSCGLLECDCGPAIIGIRRGGAVVTAPPQISKARWTYISVTVILVAAPRTVTGPLSEVKLPTCPKHSPPVLMEPPISEVVSAPPASRLNVPMAGSVVVLLARHVTKPGSLTRNDEPITLTLRDVMFGSVPVKARYCVCQGSVSVRIVADPEEHGPSIALVMKPIREPTTLAI